MRLFKRYAFDHGMVGYKLAWSPVGPPLMTVYLFQKDQVFFDTGLSHMGPEVVGLAQNQKVGSVFLTHHHEDHSGNAAAVAKATGAGIFGHDLTREKMAGPGPILPYQRYVWGRSRAVDVDPVAPDVEIPGLGPMETCHTPGHARDHLVYFFPDKGMVISGDLFLAERIKYFRSDEDVCEQIRSLKKVLALDFDMLLCSHYPRKTGGKKALAAKLAFLENLEGGILDCHGKGMDERAIFKALSLEEDHVTRWITFGNVSMMNAVRSVLRTVATHRN